METLNPDFVVWCCVQVVALHLAAVNWCLFRVTRSLGAEDGARRTWLEVRR